MLVIKNVKQVVQDFTPMCECTICFNLEATQDAIYMGAEVEEEYYKVLGKSIIDGVKAMNFK